MNDTVDNIRIIAFDVFGTVVDWHGTVAREAAELGLEVDPGKFALAWRAGYQPAMREVMERGEWIILDELHRRILDRVLDDFGIDLPEEGRRRLNLVWHRLDPWPDSVEGLSRLKSKYIVCSLSNGNIGLLTEMAKHAGLPWDCILSAENFNKYKPHPDTYLGVARTFDAPPDEVMLAAAHHSDLEAARNCGLQTAYIERPWEYGHERPKKVDPWEANTLHASSIVDLAEQLGC
ncbi:MAG TPA: haloacid dehalogenase type II [Gammaproteobacteria bacterium]|nr:haloacid dehalogenase type II [Gammaproteobacteria bacterium]